MLLYEKYLLKVYNDRYNFPVITDKGIIAYQTTVDNAQKIHFILYESSNHKNNFTKYNFKNYYIESNGTGESFLKENFDEVDYCNYFLQFYNKKKKIKTNVYSIAKSYDEFLCMLWKSFVIIKDDWFGKNYSKIPLYILDSIDDKLSASYKVEKIKEILEFLKVNFYNFYTFWFYYISPFNNMPYLTWFHEFVES